ncbi:MAG: AEC family transporter [Ardenticatenia bacterium]|nr:AEC family transporter [Ardenticatenia bacterium]
MSVLLNVVLPVFLTAGVAAVVQPRLRLDVRTVSRASFYLFSPALVLDALMQSRVGGHEFAQIAAVLVMTTGVLWATSAIVSRYLGLDGPTRSAFLVAVLLMNAGNFGLPVSLFAFGEEGLARATVYFTVSALLSSSLGVYLAARGRATATMALKRVYSVPIVYAALLGGLINFTGVTLPEPLFKVVRLLGQAAVPVMLTVLGIQLVATFQGRTPLTHVRALGAVALLRLLVAPSVALAVSGLLGLNPFTARVVTLQSAMPTAVMTTILATEFDTNPPFMAMSVFFTTALSLLTIVLLLNWWL